MRRPVPQGTERRDTWWLEPLIVVLVLGSFIIYTTWAMLQGAYYHAAPYLSPFYSPCLAANCAHVSLPIIGTWWTLTPALLIFWIPLGFRTTCYYYRKAYYRSFFWAPPACAVPDAAKGYSGETRFPFLLQNIHRYFFWPAVLVVIFLWWDVIQAFRFPTASGGVAFGMGLGTLVLLANSALLSFYTLSCHFARHLCGGYLNQFHRAPLRYRLWHIITRANEHHQLYAWISLFGVALADLYVRLLAMGIIQDVRFF
ncbi:MAG: hypothetical protein HY690_06825 [Chloroflexi bacterium]|nr:hypothetical protein [Chloroflexota bacterium]